MTGTNFIGELKVAALNAAKFEIEKIKETSKSKRESGWIMPDEADYKAEIYHLLRNKFGRKEALHLFLESTPYPVIRSKSGERPDITFWDEKTETIYTVEIKWEEKSSTRKWKNRMLSLILHDKKKLLSYRWRGKNLKHILLFGFVDKYYKLQSYKPKYEEMFDMLCASLTEEFGGEIIDKTVFLSVF